MNIYSDGSTKGQIMGAGLWVEREPHSVEEHVAFTHEPYAEANLSELFGIEEALRLIEEEGEEENTIFCDNPMVLQAILRQKTLIKTRHDEVKAYALRKKIEQLRQQGCNVSLRLYVKNNEVHEERLARCHDLSRSYLNDVNVEAWVQTPPLVQPIEDIYFVDMREEGTYELFR